MSAIAQFVARGRATWMSLQARERLALAGGSVVLALVLGYFLVVEPWRALQARLDSGLPALRADLARMNRMAAEADALKALPVSAAWGQPAATALQQAIARTVWPAAAPVLRDDGQGRLQLTVGAVRYKDLVGWLEQLQQTSRLRIATANFVRLEGATGMIRADLVFEEAGAR